MLRLRGVPFKAKPNDIVDFIKPVCEVDLATIQIGKKRRAKTLNYAVPKIGEAWIPMKEAEAKKVKDALNRHTLMDRYIDVDYTDVDQAPIPPGLDASEATKSAPSSQPKRRKVEEIKEEREVFVRFLPFEATQDDVQRLFEKAGSVSRVKLIGSSGLGFVTFNTNEEASKAITSLDGAPFKSRTLKVCWGSERKSSSKKPEAPSAPPSRKLFIQGLSFEAEEDHIASFISLQCGYRPEVSLVADKERPEQRLGRAIALFSSIDEATQACEALTGKMMGGRKLRVTPCREKDVRLAKDSSGKVGEVFLKWLPLDCEEDCIRSLTKKLLPDEVNIVNIKMLRDHSQCFKGVAFLSLEGILVQKAAELINGHEIRGRNIEASVAVAKKKR